MLYLENLFEIFLAYFVGVFYLVFHKNRNVWMIIERGTDARDNGYFFFKYLREEHPEIRVIYVITDDSPDRERVTSIGETVTFMSFKHKVFYAISKVKASTHHNINSPYKGHFRWADEISSCFGTKIMLQHGITKDKMPYFHYPWLRADLFICGAKPEYEYIRNTFGYKDGVVQYTGFARYDNLLKEHNLKKQILIMPTWRHYIVNSSDEFKNSLLYKKYQTLLSSDELRKLIEEYNYDVIFYPHYEMQPFINLFQTISDKIKIADIKSYDVQKLLMESEILITDYSSVFFDFAYMKKPLIYYQFDKEEYRKGHYEEGYFDYNENGFGPVVEEENALIKKLEEILQRKEIEEKYLDRINDFFIFRDNNNCNRIFHEIKKKISK